jgi:hypothetical protein
MELNRLHTKRINENRIIDQQHQGGDINLTVQALETYRKRPASFILVWESLTGVLSQFASSGPAWFGRPP